VWSGYGSGYGFVPLVLPVFGLLWLRHWARRAKAQAAVVTSAGAADIAGLPGLAGETVEQDTAGGRSA